MAVKLTLASLARWRRSAAHAASMIGRAVASAPRRIRSRWSRLTHFQQHWIWNIAIGVAIELALVLAAGTHFVVGAQNWAMDSTLRRLSSLNQVQQIVLTGPSASPLVTIVDADEETWRSSEWGSGPYRAPRRALGDLVETAVAAHARYIVLDVALEAQAANPSRDPSYASEDAALAARLAKLQPALAARGGAIILVRSLREPLLASDQLAPVLPASPLDKLTAAYPAQYIDATPYFVTDRDGVLRSWRLWRGACAADGPAAGAAGHWVTLPSVQLAIKAAEENSPGAPWIAPRPRRACLLGLGAASGGSFSDATDGEAWLNAHVLEWLRRNPRITGRSVEGFSAGFASGDRNGFDPRSRIYFAAGYPSQFGGIQVVSALKVLQAWSDGKTFGTEPHLPPSVGPIVIIGQSSDAVGDVHATPLGSMPGEMVLANAVYSMYRHGIVQQAPEIVSLPFTIIAIVVIGFVLARYDSVRGALALGVVFYLSLVVTNYLMLLTQYWFDFAVPLIGIYADRLLSAFEEHVKLRTITRSRAIHGTAQGGRNEHC